MAKQKVHHDRVKYVGTTRPQASRVPLYVITMLLCSLVGFAVGEVIEIRDDYGGIWPALNHLSSNPRDIVFGPGIIIGLLASWLMGMLICIYIWAMPHKFLWGIEQGEEQWADLKDMRNRLEDPDPGKNRILTEHLKMSIDAKVTDLNNNMLIIGAPGTRKSHGLIRPNLLACVGSMVVTDPKGELLRTTGKYLKKHGYEIKVLNLINMDKSDFYNPFDFISSIDDIPKILTVLFENTDDPNAAKGDPFWEKAEMMLDQAIAKYLFLETENPTFNDLVDIINEIVIKTDKQGNVLPNDLDMRMDKLPDGHPAKVDYKKVMTGAADTVRSVVITAQARLNIFTNRKLVKMMSANSLDFRRMGMEQKTAFFMVIPDVDKTYNAIAAIAYNQLIQELFAVADEQMDGRLKIPVTMWLDEFANISMPKDFLTYLATMRGRLISACMVIQGLSQLKDRYKEAWETAANCCDTIIFLGGSSLETNKWLSEEIGKRTFDKYTYGVSQGQHGSSSRNQDVYGRELLSPSELRRLPRSKALVIIAGEFPVYDDKYLTHFKPEFKEAVELGEYDHVMTDEEKKEQEQSAKESAASIRLAALGKEVYEGLKEQYEYLDGVRKQALEAYCKKENIPFMDVDIPDVSPNDELDDALYNCFDKFNAEQRKVLKDAVLAGIPAKLLADNIDPKSSIENIKLKCAMALADPRYKKSKE